MEEKYKHEPFIIKEILVFKKKCCMFQADRVVRLVKGM